MFSTCFSRTCCWPAAILVGMSGLAVAAEAQSAKGVFDVRDYGAVGLVSAMVVGYLVSLILPGQPQNLDGLTVYTINKWTK